MTTENFSSPELFLLYPKYILAFKQSIVPWSTEGDSLEREVGICFLSKLHKNGEK